MAVIETVFFSYNFESKKRKYWINKNWTKKNAMIPKLYVARISILTVCHVKDLNWAKTHRWTPRSTATQAPAHPTVVQWCQKKYILYIKKTKKTVTKWYQVITTPEKFGYIRTCLETYCTVKNTYGHVWCGTVWSGTLNRKWRITFLNVKTNYRRLPKLE